MERPEKEAFSAADIEERIIDFMEREQLSPKGRIDPLDDLLSGEVLDSVGVLRLAAWVEEEFGLRIQPTDYVVENFQNVTVLTGFVRRSQGSTPGESTS